MEEFSNYWFAKFLFKRGLGLIYLFAFTVSLRQFKPLIGKEGIKESRWWKREEIGIYFPEISGTGK